MFKTSDLTKDKEPNSQATEITTNISKKKYDIFLQINLFCIQKYAVGENCIWIIILNTNYNEQYKARSDAIII